MNAGTQHNVAPSAAMSTSEPRAANSTEREYLAHEAADAKTAMSRTLESLKASLAASADLRLWVSQHPWASIGIAVVGGFAAATAVTPKPGERLTEKCSKLAEQLAPRNGDQPPSGQPAAGPPLVTTVVESFFDLAKVAIQSAIAGSRDAPASGETPTEDDFATAGQDGR